MFKTKVFYLNNLPSANQFSSGAVLIYDKNLNNKPRIKKYISQYRHRIAVNGGEKAKTLKTFNIVALKAHSFVGEYSKSCIQIISLGGGSIEDLAGFFASTYKRGVELIHIPTTWLSAIDSAHGGKNALNLNNFKNQIGTIYPAKSIYLVKNILEDLEPEFEYTAMGEILKTAFLDKTFFKILQSANKFNIWKNLNNLIKVKEKYFTRDIFETKGIRTKLNLGHTLAHGIELENKFLHGVAVAWGLIFTLELSYYLKQLNQNHYSEAFQLINKYFLIHNPDPPRLNLNRIKKTLLGDKKNTKNNKIRFVLYKSPGKYNLSHVEFKTVETILKRLGWI